MDTQEDMDLTEALFAFSETISKSKALLAEADAFEGENLEKYVGGIEGMVDTATA